MVLRVCLVVVLTLAGVTLGVPSNKGGESFKLIVLHNNDMHARFEQTNAQSGKCSHKQEVGNLCFGGFPRVAHIVKQTKRTESNVIFLNAGDTYQGTMWYTVHKWPVVANFTQLIGLDAMSLGNHEFDDGVEGLAPFLSAITVPVVGANLQLEREPRLAALIKPSTVLSVGGRKVGVIGYLTAETTDIANPGSTVEFADEVTSIRREAARLKGEGVDILIALGHSGFGTDKRIAREVADIDLVIGGHTNTFLYTGDRPDGEVPAGLYPTVVTQTSGRQVPVVSAYAFTKYMGRVELTFDPNGEVTHFQGNPILLDRTVPQDEEVLAALTPWRNSLRDFGRKEMGRTRVYLNGSQEECRMRECNLGNLITDAYVQYNAWLRLGSISGWTDASIGIQNGGGIRGSIDEKANNGTVTMEDILSVLPFQNSIVRYTLQGRYLLEVLEISVTDYDRSGVEAPGKFLQFSGVQVTYDLDRPAGSRVVSAQVRCSDCRVPRYEDIQPNKKYGLISTVFVADGGDGYHVIKEKAEDKLILDASESDVLAEFFKRKSPVAPGLEHRVRLLNTGDPGSGSAPGARASLGLLATLLLLHLLRTAAP